MKSKYKQFKIPMPCGARLIPFPTLTRGRLILFGPWSPWTCSHQTWLWSGTDAKAKYGNLHPQKWDFQTYSLLHQPPHGLQNRRGRLKSINRRLENFSLEKLSKSRKKKTQKNKKARLLIFRSLLLMVQWWNSQVSKACGEQGFWAAC